MSSLPTNSEFKNFVCWNPERIISVMDPEALYTPASVFLATHHPSNMMRGEVHSVGGRFENVITEEKYDEKQFLADFLDPRTDHSFVPVIGHAGTGKSHVIRWLYYNIPKQDNRRVLLLEKSNTNLKEIIEKILYLPGTEGIRFDNYRHKLKEAVSELSGGQVRDLLLDNLATLVGPNEQRDTNALSSEQRYLIRSLPDFLRDPHFRPHFLRDGGLIHSLVNHVIGSGNVIERLDERRGFTADDIPQNITSEIDASKRAREFYGSYRLRPQLIGLMVGWLNQHLDEAIAMILRFNREDLQRLMRDVRMALAEDGVELVLLIEDFAKLQGIDMQVLEAILVRPNPDEVVRLCTMRTALACTTGYFEDLRDTVQQRTSFIVSLDVGEVKSQALVTPTDVQHFVSKYLNAARLPESILQNWYNQRTDENDTTEVPNYCLECPFAEPCHTAFGSAGGIGLYPFTPIALQRMLQRVTDGEFNPRLLIKHVLMKPLQDYADSLREGSFPPPSLSQAFNGSQVPAIVHMELERLDPANYHRREVLLDLWNDGNTVHNLDPVIHQAFDLPLLSGIEENALPVVQVAGENPLTQPETRTATVDLNKKLALLDEWGNGAQLPQTIASELRVHIFNAIRERIEWDSEMLLPTQFAGSDRPFQTASIYFERGYQLTVKSGVELQMRATRSAEEGGVVALQALLKYQHFKSWDYHGGAQELRIYARELDKWCREVVAQIRRPNASGEPWDPIPAAVELLALGARMANRPAATETSIAAKINALFEDFTSSDQSTRSDSWKKLFAAFIKYREKILNILVSRIPCTKGGSGSPQMIDVSRLIQPVKNIGRVGPPQVIIPSDLRAEFVPLIKLREKVDQLFSAAVSNERQRHKDWYDLVTSQLGEDGNAKAPADAVETAITKAQEAGCFLGVSQGDLSESIKQFKNAKVEHCLSAVRRVISEDSDDATVLLELSRVPQATMLTVNDFLDRSNRFLEASLKRVKADVDELLIGGGQDLETSKEGIEESLTSLRNIVRTVKG